MQSDSLITVLQSVGTVVWQAAKRQIYIDLTMNFACFLGLTLLGIRYHKHVVEKIKEISNYDGEEAGVGYVIVALIFTVLYVVFFYSLLSLVTQVLNPDMAAFNRLMGR